MDFEQIPTTIKAAAALLGLFITYQIYIQLTLGRKRRALCYEKGVMPVPWLDTLKDRWMGLDLFTQNIKERKEHHLLGSIADRFHRMRVNTMKVVMLGRTVYITIEPENLKVIQAVEHKKWSLGTRRKAGFKPLLGDGIFTLDGPEWAHSREMLRPNFVRSQVGDLATFEKHVAHLIAAVPRDGSTVNLSDLFFRLTMDSATEFLFGESTESLIGGSDDRFADSFARSQSHISSNSRWGPWVFLRPRNKDWDVDQKFVHDFVDKYVDKGLAKRNELSAEKLDTEKPGRYIFIDELIRQTSDRLRIRSELLNILLAGRDTTASLLTNMFFTLSKRPDIWNRLQSEVAELHGEAPTFDQLKDMKYTRALMNESLRLYPIVPANSREAFEDTTLPVGGGPDGRAPILICKGEVVSWSVYSMHRRKDYYGEDAEEFKPERWLDDPVTGRKGLRPGWEYLPFNGGARICLGQQFALNEASYTTVRLCQAFEKIESRDPEPWREQMTLTCVNLGGAKVALTPRAV